MYFNVSFREKVKEMWSVNDGIDYKSVQGLCYLYASFNRKRDITFTSFPIGSNYTNCYNVASEYLHQNMI